MFSALLKLTILSTVLNNTQSGAFSVNDVLVHAGGSSLVSLEDAYSNGIQSMACLSVVLGPVDLNITAAWYVLLLF